MPDDMPLLQGLRVLDLGQGIAGPYCGAILQQQGAEVIKVEPPAGDWARNMGVSHGDFSAVVMSYNAGKAGLCIDATTDAGQSVVRRLAQQVDVVIQNFRCGVVKRLNIGYESLAALNPRLIYVSISGFGPDGPLAQLPATDNVLQAMTGMMNANRSASGVPQKIGIYLADLATAIYASQLVSAALYRRSITGKGRHLQLSLYEACCALQSSNIADAVFSGSRPAARTATAPSGIFQVGDGHVTLATLDTAMFGRLCDALELHAMKAEPRFASNQTRLVHAEILNENVGRVLIENTLAHWCRKLQAADVLHAPVRNYKELLADPQARHANIFGQVENAGLPSIPRARYPGCTAATKAEAAPRLGEHTGQVLASFGFSSREIADLAAAGVVRFSAPSASE